MVETLKPLKGKRILQLCSLLPCPFVGLILSDLGATVTKVEPPSGDFVKKVPPFAYNMGLLYHALNRGKRVVTADLRQGKDKVLIQRLIAESDVVIGAFRGDFFKDKGFKIDDFLVKKPELIWVNMPAYPSNSKYKTRAAHDLNLMALSGAMYEQRRPLPVQVADMSTAFVAVITILSALLQKTGGFFEIPLSMGAVMGSFPIYARFTSKQDFTSENRLIEGGSPFYNIYETADSKRISIAAIEPKFIKRIVSVTRGEELKQWFKKRSLEEILQEFSESLDCIEPVIAPWQTHEHPAIKGLFATLESEKGIKYILPITPFADPKDIPESGPWVY